MLTCRLIALEYIHYTFQKTDNVVREKDITKGLSYISYFLFSETAFFIEWLKYIIFVM